MRTLFLLTALFSTAAAFSQSRPRPPLPPPQELPPITRTMGKAPPPPMTSERGEIAVFARDESRTMLRWPIMQFAERTKGELEQCIKLRFGSGKVPLEIAIGSVTNSTDVLVKITRASDNALRARIEIPDPDHCDLMRLREVIVGAFISIWVEENRASPFAVTPPDWLIYGITRCLNSAEKLEDTEAFWQPWSECGTPMFDEIFTENQIWLKGHPPTRTMLTLFLSEAWADGLRGLLGEYAAGRPVTRQRLAKEALNIDETGWPCDLALDRAWDLFCKTQSNRITVLASLTSGSLQRWALNLDTTFQHIAADLTPPWVPRTPAWVLKHASDPAVRIAAASTPTGLYLGAHLRHQLLKELATQYAQFFEAVARGEKQQTLALMLEQAENNRRTLTRLLRRGPLYTQAEVTPAPTE